MIFLKDVFLFFIGISSGAIIAAGVFAFITVIGLIPRLAAKSHTAEHVHLYETLIVLGGAAGNVIDLYHFPLFGGLIAILVFGIFSGIFVGCLVMSIAETLDTIPVFVRRIRLLKGLPYAILSMAIGKMVSSLLYFIYDMAAP